MKKIYLDSAATTYIDHEVLMEMMPIFNSTYGNTNSLHYLGREAVSHLDVARSRVQRAIKASKPSEIYFTSGGTEANNWAILGLARAHKKNGNHVIVSAIEHHSILAAAKQLELEGFEVSYAPADENGVVSLVEIMRLINSRTILISVMMANNEVGTIQNTKAIAFTAKEKQILFHTDAVQALGTLNISVEDLGVDALTISAHKIYGPKGAGALYLKKGVSIKNIIFGGNQESGLRGGTVNLPAVVGLGKAAEICSRNVEYFDVKMKKLRDYFEAQVLERIEKVKINGHLHQRLSFISNLSFEFVDNDSLLALLDMEGIAASAGSACMSGSTKPSHVLKGMGLSLELAKSAVRFSLTKKTTKEEIDDVVDFLEKAVEKLRKISPLNRSQLGGK